MSKSYNDDNYACPVFASTGKCGEQDALRVMEQFKDFYEGKLSEIDVQGGGDCLELKLKIQRRWIDDLTEQTQMMAKIVKELEDEATSRVRMLEDKLRQTSKSAYEKAFYVESDLKNVVEFVRRIREDKNWSIDGLHFYDVTYKDLFGKDRSEYDDNASNNKSLVPITNGINNNDNKKEAPSSDEKNEEIIQTSEELLDQLRKKTEDYEQLKLSMLDMRTALTEEVACKHDMISALKKDVQQLEERCIQSDKQTAFKDDIIKELRKEIKQMKQQHASNLQNTESKVIRHSHRAEKARFSTVIFINESDVVDSEQMEVPVKEKSKFTMTNLSGCKKFGGVDRGRLDKIKGDYIFS